MKKSFLGLVKIYLVLLKFVLIENSQTAFKNSFLC